MFVMSRHYCSRITLIRGFIQRSRNTLSRRDNFLETINKILPKSCFSRSLCSSALVSNDTEEQRLDFAAITNGNEELVHKLKVILLELDVLRQEGKLVPPSESISVEQWKEILSLPTISARRRYCLYLFKTLMTRENRKKQKLEKQLLWEEKKKNVVVEEPKTMEEFAQTYDLKHNNIFIRIRDRTINRLYNNRLVIAMKFGQKLVIDCGYETNMTKRENLLCAKQLMLLFAENRQHDDPYDIHFCNMNRNDIIFHQLKKFIPTIEELDFPINIHEGSYLDLFPKEQLVYLTPHTRDEVVEYDHDAIYIVGGIVDKVNNEPLSLAKAKKEGLKMAKFPLDRYLQWGAGSGKSLTINQATSILLDMKSTGNWEHAFRHVPKRKIANFEIEAHLEKKSNLRYDRPKQSIPSREINFDHLKYNQKNKNKETRKWKPKVKEILRDTW